MNQKETLELNDYIKRENELAEQRETALREYLQLIEQTEQLHRQKGRLKSAVDRLEQSKQAEHTRLAPLQQAHDNDKLWQRYDELRKLLDPKIDAMKLEADEIHRTMQDSFCYSRRAYQGQSHDAAGELSDYGRELQVRRNQLNERVSSMIRQLKEAKQEAMLSSPPVDWSKYRQYKKELERLRSKLKTLEQDFKKLRAAREQKCREFEKLHMQHYDAATARQEIQAEVSHL